jgi:hypothetical protein
VPETEQKFFARYQSPEGTSEISPAHRAGFVATKKSVLKGRRKIQRRFPASLPGRKFIWCGHQPLCGWLISVAALWLKNVSGQRPSFPFI